MIKTQKTSKGISKIIVSGKQAKSLYNLLENMPVLEIGKYVGGKETCDICDIWWELEQAYSQECA